MNCNNYIQKADGGYAASRMENMDEIAFDPSHLEKVRLGTTLEANLSRRLKEFLRRHVNCFAWSHRDMVGVDPDIASHHLQVDPDFTPVWHKRRKFASEKNKKINKVVHRLLDNGLVREVKYPDWLANMVVVWKKEESERYTFTLQTWIRSV